MIIYRTRYLAEKARETSPQYSTADRIVKVSGGYTIMTEREYRVWKGQR